MSKKVVAVVIAFILVIVAVAGTFVFLRGKTNSVTTEVIAGENQRVVYAYITDISGNEITYMELEESVVTAALEESDSTEEKTEQSEGEMPEGEMPKGEMPEGEMPSGGAPEGDMPEGGMSQKGISTEGNQSITTMIPVGTVVHTSDDATTTFSRLVSGDLLEMLVETDANGEEVIVEIWMLQA